MFNLKRGQPYSGRDPVAQVGAAERCPFSLACPLCIFKKSSGMVDKLTISKRVRQTDRMRIAPQVSLYFVMDSEGGICPEPYALPCQIEVINRSMESKKTYTDEIVHLMTEPLIFRSYRRDQFPVGQPQTFECLVALPWIGVRSNITQEFAFVVLVEVWFAAKPTDKVRTTACAYLERATVV